MSPIRFGPLFFPTNDGPDAIEMAVAAENWGYDSFWLPDYVMRPYMDPFVLAGAIAQQTTRIRLGTAVALAAFRTPFQLAKSAGSVDQLSHGRFSLGVGIGGSEAEFKATGIDFESRGRLVTETIEITRRFLSGAETSYDGEFYRFADIAVGPVPVQDPLPIWVGGLGARGFAAGVLRRAALFGDGFLPFETSIEAYRTAQTRISEIAARGGRDPADISWGLLAWTCQGKDRADAARIAKREISKRLGIDYPVHPEDGFALGTPGEMIETLERYVELGLTEFVIDPGCAPSKIMPLLEVFAREVIPHFR